MRHRLLTLLFIFITCNGVFGYEHPFVDISIDGTVIDFKTKKPVNNVQIIVFINNREYSSHPDPAFEYPKLPFSNPSGVYKGKARLPSYEIEYVEIIAMAECYWTKRYKFKSNEFINYKKHKNALAVEIQVPTVELLQTENAQQCTPADAKKRRG